MVKSKKIDSFFTKKDQVVAVDSSHLIAVIPMCISQDEPELADPIPLVSTVQDFIKADPALRRQIWACPADKQDEIRKAYMQLGPYQPKKDVYPTSGEEGHRRRFQYHWFVSFSWLEYSPTKDAAFCFPCFLFSKKPKGKCGSNTFTIKGFQKWKKGE